jgi:subtilisin family serine protease
MQKRHPYSIRVNKERFIKFTSGGKQMKFSLRIIQKLAFFTSILLSACGGGGDDSNAPKDYALAKPTQLTSRPAVATPSFPVSVTNYGYGAITFPYESFIDSDGSVVTAPEATTGLIPIFPVTHLNDVSVNAAWAAGWTGRGVTILIIDDFSSTDVPLEVQLQNVPRSKTFSNWNGSYTGKYSLDYAFRDLSAHGALVSNIAGGDHDSQLMTVKTQLQPLSMGSLIQCSVTQAPGQYAIFAPECPLTFYSNYFYTPTTTHTIVAHKVAGIAKESLVVNDNVNLSNSQDALETVTFIQGHLANSTPSDVINLSFGSDIPTTGKTFYQVMEAVTENNLAAISSSVIVVAAGNGGAPCATQDLSGCNAVAVAMAFQDATKDITIVAGALEGTGSSENIAIYSTRAGILADRFLLAQGTSGYSGVAGTSFAAPRIAGAAAIVKQKYPTLSSKQIADVLLLSANKDINNSGRPSFTGVHPVYGHGKLDLQRALDLAGAM